MGVNLKDLPRPCPKAPSRVVSTQLRHLELRYFHPAASEMVAQFCNSLSNLQHLELREHEEPSTMGASIVPLLELPGLIFFSFRASEGNDYGLQSPIDLRHFSRLPSVQLALRRSISLYRSLQR